MNILSSLLNFIGEFIGSDPDTLTTTSKTAVGAINELDSDVSSLQSSVSSIQTALTVTTPTISITPTTGTLNASYVRRYGKIVQLTITIKNASSVAAGANAFLGTLNTTALRPILAVNGCGYYGQNAFLGNLTNNGTLTVRNASSTAITPSEGVALSFTYIVA